MKKLGQKSGRQLQFRRTIKNSGFVEGIGIHSGEKTKLIFHPADEGTGIVFLRSTGPQKQSRLLVSLNSVIDTSLAVTLGNSDYHVQTVEHLLYGIFVLGITDLIIEVQKGHEVPILDGSAYDFVKALNELEFHEHPTEWTPITIERPVMVTDGNRYLVALPAENFRISYSIDYPHPLLKDQAVELDFQSKFFQDIVASARTFGFVKDVDALRAKGLAQGGSTNNVLVYTNDSTLNEPRFDRESLYHKILDLVGDLALVGRPIQGHILGARGGHALDVAFGKKIVHNFGH